MEALHFSSAPETVSDAVAVGEVLRGNREMFEVIVRRHNPRLYRVGMAYLRDHAKAEDAMQSAYIRAYQHLADYKRSAAFATWLTRIMINECLMLLRRERRRPVESLEDDRLADDIGATAVLTDDVQLNEMKAFLEAAVSTLPQAYRAVYILREVQQLSTEETAEALGVSVESVKVTLHRARNRLKTELMNTAAGVELFRYPAEFCTPMTERVLAAILSLPTRSPS